MTSDLAAPLTDHRRRLLDAMAHAVAGKGYAAVTIADLAAEARVSKRSFYEHFADKAECLIALYEAASRQSLEVLRTAIDPHRDWHQQVEHSLKAYFETLACNPPLLRTLFIDIIALGPDGLAARRRTTQHIAELIVEVTGGSLPRAMAVAIVGAIHEWVLEAVEQDRVARLPELVGPAARLVRAVVDHHA
ncbi:TetR/AcrR family transcriptional regulator [Aquincola sp. S2]|uniref:TetR/AcrR family transcriptional regulator n=1 Tax=Pseudaquabacterium terrae TaxID=2732868 RepID=A0ABX2EHZ3_9BURK|nr:TetR/AcrR family transcriptional regulator [Aquabacterium terrae]NRF68253.1 TetR/AcrR family transcriptional regulator [Aquabacterium terrae]